MNYPLSYTALCLNLGLRSPDDAQIDYLASLLDAAAEELADAGISIDESVPRERCLLTIYAAWLYRNRASGEGKPAMLQRLMNNARTRQARA